MSGKYLYAIRTCVRWLWLDILRIYNENWRSRWRLAIRIYELRRKRSDKVP